MEKTTIKTDNVGIGVENGYAVLGHNPEKGIIIKTLNKEEIKKSNDIVLEIIEVTRDESDKSKPRIENTLLTVNILDKKHTVDGCIDEFKVSISSSQPINILSPEVNIVGKLKVNGVEVNVP